MALAAVGAAPAILFALGCGGSSVSSETTGDPTGGAGGAVSESTGGNAGSPSSSVGGSGGELTAEPLTNLEGREFILQSVDGDTPLGGTTIHIWFEGGIFNFMAACNGHSTSYEVCGSGLGVGEWMSTLIACGSPYHERDAFVADFFTAQPEMTLSGNDLTVVGSGVTMHFLDREVADPDRPLTGRTWDVINFMDAQSTSAYALPAQPTLHFGEDGSLQIFTSCNTGAGTFAVNDGTLTLSDISITEEVCDDQNAATVDAHLKAVLATGEATFTIEATYLTVYRGELGFLAETE